jgi:hypothetical protein
VALKESYSVWLTKHVFSASEVDIVNSSVYDVSNRETFEALPRWYSELETYVSSSVVKILVGNKLDKVFSLFQLT